MIEIPPELIELAIADVEREMTVPARTEQSQDILESVRRTLQWILAGTKGPLLNLNSVLCREQIFDCPDRVRDAAFHRGSAADA